MTIPAVLRRNLRQEQPSPRAMFDDETVAADLDGEVIVHAFWRSEQRQIDCRALQLVLAQRRKAVVLVCDGTGKTGNRLDDAIGAIERAKAAAQIGAVINRHEHAKRVDGDISRHRRRRLSSHPGLEEGAREAQQLLASRRVNHFQIAAER